MSIALPSQNPEIAAHNDALRHALSERNIQVIDATAPLAKGGDQILSRLVDEKAFKNAKGYVFMGEPDLQSTFLLYYLVDAAQSGLPNAFSNSAITDEGKSKLKPIVICNYGPDGTKPASAFLQRAQKLYDHKLLKRKLEDIVHVVDHPDGIVPALNSPKLQNLFESPKLKPDLQLTDAPPRDEEKSSVFLCCSFFTNNEFYVELAKQLGQQLAENDYNLVTGGGRYPNGDPNHGMMYNAQKSHYDAGGDVTGVTFSELNPLADHPGKGAPHFGISRIIKTRHLPERVEVMSDLSDVVVIAPGGFGTDTEAMGPLLMKQVSSALMDDKPLIIVNTRDPQQPDSEGGHDSLIALLQTLNLKEGEDFHLVESPQGINDSKALAEATARAVIDKLSGLNVHTHARRLALSQSVSRSSHLGSY